MCYRFQNQKIEESRNKTQNKGKTVRGNQFSVNHANQGVSNKGRNSFNPERPESSGKFRIKNVTTTLSTNPSALATKNTSVVDKKKEEKLKEIKREPFHRVVAQQ